MTTTTTTPTMTAISTTAGKRKSGRILRWVGILLGIVALLAAGFYLAQSGLLNGILPGTSQTAAGQFPVATANLASMPSTDSGVTTLATTASGDLPVTAIRSAADSVGSVGAAGNLALVSEEVAILRVGGIVDEVFVRVGDVVQEGDLLATLESGSLEDGVQTSLLNLSVAQLQLAEVQSGATASEIATAQANLLTAQQNLVDLTAGATSAEIASAQASLASAQANVDELLAGPSQDELTQLSANLRKAELTLADAQRAYNQVSWRNDIGATSQASDLQSATIDYESTLAAYNQSIAPASDADVQSANAQVTSAQQTLSELFTPPTDAEIAAAEASITSAQAALDDLLAGPTEVNLQNAQLSVEQARISLESAADDLTQAEVRSPASGTILSVNLATGQQTSSGATAVTLADTSKLELTVNVAEADIINVAVGMEASISIDAIPGRTFIGAVTEIAPSASSSSGVVNYPVTIQLTESDLGNARAGMTAVATMQIPAAEGGWLVPSTAIREGDGSSQVLVVRDGTTTAVNVTLGAVSGEWQVVQSDSLRAGDQVVGTVSSYINDSQQTFGGAGGGMMGGGGAPPTGGMGGRP
jgi:HlyD family secretion protein